MSLTAPKATRWAVVGLTWVAFLLRTVTLAGQSLWRDEVDAIRFSSWPIDDLLAGLFSAGHNGPLFFVLLHFWRTLTGDSEFALRYPSAVLGTVAVPLGLVLTRQLGFSRRAGVLLSLLLATSPYLVWYGQEAKMYTLLLVLVTVAFIAYLKALAGAGTRWWVLFVVATSLSFYTHILSPLMLAVYGLVALLQHHHLRRRWRGWLISMACLTVPYVPLALWQFPLLLQGFNSGHPFYSLSEEIHLLLKLYSSGLIRFARLIPLILFLFLFLSGLFLAKNGRRRFSRYILAGWVLLPPLVVYLISLRVHVFEDRYLIYITPAFYLLIALGLMALRRHLPWLASFCLGLILTINFMGIWHQQHQPVKADFRAVADYLTNQPRPPSPILVQIPYLQHTLNYYYKQDYAFLEGLWTNDNKTEAVVDAEMTALTRGLTDVWVVISEEDMWDRRRLMRAWLEEHAHLVKEAHFNRVDVYHYQLRPGFIEQPKAEASPN